MIGCIDRFVVFVAGATIVCLVVGGIALVSIARGQGVLEGNFFAGWGTSSGACPPERPHQRQMVSPAVTCTLLACLGRLSCPSDGSACFHIPTDCNRCISRITQVCLSDDELREAQR